jgi:hypothetical protein
MSNTYNTIDDVISYVKPIVDDYRHFESHKETGAQLLEVIFKLSNEPWKRVIEGGKFKRTFTKAMGIGRMKYLKKMLYIVDEQYYSTIDFSDSDN